MEGLIALAVIAAIVRVGIFIFCPDLDALMSGGTNDQDDDYPHREYWDSDDVNPSESKDIIDPLLRGANYSRNIGSWGNNWNVNNP